MVKMKKKIWVVIILILVIIIIIKKPELQTVAPECFTHDECRVPVKTGYCNVRYECIVGKCYHEFIPCQEICYGGEDEDMDGIIDCDDTDCYDSPYCACEIASFNRCKSGLCFCEKGKFPKWTVTEIEHWCQCI